MKLIGLKMEQVIVLVGLLRFEKKNCFQMSKFSNGRNFSIIEGFWKVGTGVQVIIVNIYCSGSLREKKLVWEEIGAYNST